MATLIQLMQNILSQKDPLLPYETKVGDSQGVLAGLYAGFSL